jgi:CBS domain-containing protein
MKVEDLMTTHVISVSPSTPVHEVAETLAQYHFTGVPVVDNGTVVGLIAERDFITSDSDLYLPTYIKMLTDLDFVSGDQKRLPKEAQQIINAKASDIMNKKVVTVSPNTSLEELAETFATKRVNPIPVTDPSGRMLGIISRSDLIKLFSKKQLKVQGIVGHPHRTIDENVGEVQEAFQSHFSLVTKARANVWLVVAIVLFVVGFIIGIVYVVDPNYFISSNYQNYNDSYE